MNPRLIRWIMSTSVALMALFSAFSEPVIIVRPEDPSTPTLVTITNEVRAHFSPELQALLQELDATIGSIPPTERERIVRELIAEAHQKAVELYARNDATAAPGRDANDTHQ